MAKGTSDALGELRERNIEMFVKNKHLKTEVQELRDKLAAAERVIAAQRRRLNELEKPDGGATR